MITHCAQRRKVYIIKLNSHDHGFIRQNNSVSATAVSLIRLTKTVVLVEFMKNGPVSGHYFSQYSARADLCWGIDSVVYSAGLD